MSSSGRDCSTSWVLSIYVSKVLCSKKSKCFNCKRKRSTTPRDDQKLQRIVRLFEMSWPTSERGVGKLGSRFLGHLPSQTDRTGLPKSHSALEAPSLHLTEVEMAAVVPGVTALESRGVGEQRSGARFSSVTSPTSFNILVPRAPECGERKVRNIRTLAWRGMSSFPYRWLCGAPYGQLGVSQLCFLRSTVTVAVYQDVLEHFMVPASGNLFGAVEFTFHQDSTPAHMAKTTKRWSELHHDNGLAWKFPRSLSYWESIGHCESGKSVRVHWAQQTSWRPWSRHVG